MCSLSQLAAFSLLCGTVAAAEPTAFEKTVAPFVAEYCAGCHGPEKQKGKLRFDTLRGDIKAKPDESAVWKSVLEQLETAQMPPKESPKPKPEQTDRVVRWLRAELKAAGVTLDGPSELAYPSKGNAVDHSLLFDKPSTAAPATPARIWRLSPYAYRSFMESLVGNTITPVSYKKSGVVLPYGLTSDPGFRDYAFRYKVSGSETLQMTLNAKEALETMISPRQRYSPPKVLTAITGANAPPTAEQLQAAVSYLFQRTLFRDPTAEESARYCGFAKGNIERFGNVDGLIRGLTPVLLHPDAVFRSELGAGTPDAHGRVMLAPTELALAIAYALTDDRPDATLLAAARDGKLATRDDVRREVARLLDDPKIQKQRILRFFQEYFDYADAAEVFKDEFALKAAGIGLKYNPDFLVRDTDMLVEFVLAKDRDVLKELLTTTKSFVDYEALDHWAKFRKQREDSAKKTGKPIQNHPFGSKNSINKHYNLDPADWKEQMPLELPAGQRAGVLTQPSWLIAHSTNVENHAIHRGKWVRERLLGGYIPDTPITVDAKLPEEPQETLRHRMRVTREAYCWKCHVSMDPLGLPFQIFDHIGQFRTTELGKTVDAGGEIIDSGDPAIDGKVTDALDMIRKLAGSEHVAQVFVRHAFRYWMGRNETSDDAPTMQAAYKAYREGGGSMKALIASLLTSDSFLYRTPTKTSGR